MKALSEQNHYEVLELTPGASAEAVARAYAKAKETYGPGSLATYGFAEPIEAEAVMRRVEEAYAALSNDERRKTYDEANGFVVAEAPRAVESKIEAKPKTAPEPRVEVPQEPKAEAKPEARDEPKVEPKDEPKVEPKEEPKDETPKEEAKGDSKDDAKGPPSSAGDKPVRKTEAELPLDAPVTGEALRRVREAHGFSLKDLEAKTKIGHWHLEAIEREKYQSLPAHVYLRGFLMSLARELKLDPVRVSKSYIEQMKQKQAPPKPE